MISVKMYFHKQLHLEKQEQKLDNLMYQILQDKDKYLVSLNKNIQLFVMY